MTIAIVSIIIVVAVDLVQIAVKNKLSSFQSDKSCCCKVYPHHQTFTINIITIILLVLVLVLLHYGKSI